MASLCPPPLPLSSLFIPPSKRGVPVEILCYSASHLSSLSNARRTLFGYSNLFRLVSRHISYSTHLKDNVGTTLITLQTHSFSSPSMSQISDVSGVACKGLCTVLWSIETDIADGFVMYLIGDPVALGCWDPNLAIPLSRSFHTSNLWETQIKVPCGIHFKYNYIRRHPSSVIEWRPGPEYSLSVPFSTGEFEVIRVRDCWMRESVHRFPVPLWGSWLADLGIDPLISTVQQSLSSDDSAVACEGLCKVIWSLELDITSGVLVYLTGEPEALGCWKPELAIPVSRSLQNSYLWETEVMVPCGTNIKYNYLMMMKKTSSWSIPVYRPGPKFSLSIPHSCKENGPICVRDCWVRDVGHRNLIPSWGSWLFNPSLSQDPFKVLNGSLNQASFSGQHDVLKSQNGIPLKQKPPIILRKDNKERHTESKFFPSDQTNINPFIQSTENKANCIKEKKLKDQFVEEPWLLYETRDFQIEECNQEKEPLISSIATVPETSNSKKGTTKILINSSACDMRRIAVLENGILVELILEPLNNTVLFNNIYLGVIKEMMPKRSGALVDIGLPKPVFMVIRENREPFAYSTKRIKKKIKEKQNSDCGEDTDKWAGVSVGTKIIVQVSQKEEEGTASSTDSVVLTPYPRVKSRFWIFRTRNRTLDVSVATEEPERIRLLAIAKALKPAGFGLKAKPAAVGHSSEELEKDLEILLSTWDEIVEHAKSSVQAAREGIEGAVPVMLHRAMDQNLAVIYDYFNDKVESVLVDSPRSYHEVTIDLQKIAPELCGRVELYKEKIPIFDEYKIEKEIDGILCKRVPLPDGGYLVIEQTEAFVSIDVNSGGSMLGKRTSQEKASLKVNLAAAKQIAREFRLRDIGGVVIVDFIDMANDSNKILVYEEMKKEVERDRSKVATSEISSLGLMELTREKVHRSDSFVISEPCKCCHATGRVEALETSFSKIEHEISRFLAASNEKPDPGEPKSWPRFLLKVDRHMCDYLTSGKKTKLAILSSSLKVWILLKIARGFSWGTFELTPLRGGTESYDLSGGIQKKLIEDKQKSQT